MKFLMDQPAPGDPTKTMGRLLIERLIELALEGKCWALCKVLTLWDDETPRPTIKYVYVDCEGRRLDDQTELEAAYQSSVRVLPNYHDSATE